MKLDTFKACLDKIPNKVTVIFSGFSEPWLCPDCADMILYAWNKGHKIKLYTTLVGMTEGDIEKIKHIPFSRFSIHLPSEDWKENIIVNQKYLNLLRKIIKGSFNSGFVVLGKSLHKDIKPLNIKNIWYNPGHSRAGNIRFRKNKIIRKSGPLKCSVSLGNNFTLLPDGNVSLCCMDYGLKHILGNLTTDSFLGLFTGNEFKKVQNRLLNENDDILCRYCYWSSRINSSGENIE